MVKLNAFSRSPPDFAAKNAIFRSSKSAKFHQKFCHKSCILTISSNFIKNQYFCHDGQFSSYRQLFVKNEILWSVGIRVLQYDMLSFQDAHRWL